MRGKQLIAAVAGLLALVSSLAAQQPTVPAGLTRQEALELVRTRPDLVQQQLRQSGLSEQQIRQRLQAAGLPSSMLDPYLAAQLDTTTMVTGDVLQALDLLGVALVTPQGVDSIPLSVGRSRPADAGPSRVFGVDVFRRRTTQFQPLLAGPVPEAYRVGPGDLMVLVLTGEVELVHQLPVTREGFIVIPQVGQIYVSNLTMANLRQLLRQRLARSYSGIPRGTTHIDVTIARLRAIQVSVIGEVAQPGAYNLSSVATVLNALYAAGGPTERGNFRQIRLERGGALLATLDLYHYLLRGSSTRDLVLEQGDVIFVPVRGARAVIAGAVIRPAIYEVEAGETLEDLVQMAGGFRENAELRRISVHRILSPSDRIPAAAPRSVIDVALAPKPSGGDQPRDGRVFGSLSVVVPRLSLENGDSVVIDSILPLERSLFVTISGMVNRGGPYPWTEGMSLRDLMLLARGPRVGADLREAEIARLPTDRSRGALAETFRAPLDSTYLFERDSLGRYRGPAGVSFPAPGSAPEIALQPFDHVTVFRQPEFELQRTVAISGEVPFPGPYALERKDERLSDLIRRAGGLLPTAYPDGSRFIRPLDDAGRVDVDLEAVLEDAGSPDDLILQPGDSVHVPEYIPVVRVIGEVNSPTSVRYERGRGLDYYVANAGGYSGNADRGRVSVRYANGAARVRSRFLLFTSYPEPGPGSTVVVPQRAAEGPGLDLAVLFGGIAQVLSAVTTVILVVDNLSRP